MSGRDSDSGSDNPYYTPAISRSGFAFDDGKFYAASDYYRHTRMDAKELYELLTYTPPPAVLTKKGTLAKRQPKVTHQERDTSFYAAQMAHYGLKPLKTKAAAKKRLLAALEAGGGLLAVPEHILELEVALKKEWQSADKARKRHPKKQRLAAKRVKTSSRRTYEDAFGSTFEEESEPEAISISKGKGRNDPSGSKRKVSSSKKPRTAISGNHVKAGKERKGAGKKTLTLADWAGSYIVQSKELAEEWSQAEGDQSFEVYPSSTKAHLWASFDLGIVTGVMRSLGKPPTAVGEEVHFEWRGRVGEEGETTFGRNNCGILRFSGKGTVEATMRGRPGGKFSFRGSFVGKAASVSAAAQKSKVANWKREWRGINSRNYKVESRERWGGWGGGRTNDSPFESDTSTGHYEREEEPDFGDL